jgi:GNAT superfamily N-acetyltransferase
MESNWYIRLAILEDSVGLKRCMELAYAGYQKRMGGVPLPPMNVDYVSEIRNYPVWVVEFENRVVGGLIMVFENSRATIANIAVDPGFQGQGVGGKLMQFAELKARENNFTELHLATHVLLEENVSLYQHLGWKEISSDETRIFMKKTI